MTVRRQPERERWERSNLVKIVGDPWRKNEDDPEMDGEKLKGEVVMMDKDYKGKLEREEHVPVPKRLCITREKVGRIWIHCAMSRNACRCSGERRDRRTPRNVETNWKRN